MATKLFLRDSKINAISIYRDLSVTAGAAAATGIVNSASSGTLIQWTKTAGGEALTFVSGRSPAGGWTLDGDITFSLWAKESNVLANCGIKCRLWLRAVADDSETEIDTGWSLGAPDELTTTTVEYVWTGNPTSTAFVENDRLVLRVYAINVGVMAAGHNCTLTYDAANAATGDSFISLTENVTFGDNALARVSQIIREVLVTPTTQLARVSQIVREVVVAVNLLQGELGISSAQALGVGSVTGGGPASSGASAGLIGPSCLIGGGLIGPSALISN